MMNDLCERFPPKLKVTIAEGKVALTLEAVLALDDDAARLAHQFQTERQRRLEDCLTAARQAFLESKTWQNVDMLRARLAILAGGAVDANRQLNETRTMYQRDLANGDPVSLLSEMSAKQIAAENARRAVDDFERDFVRPAEQTAAFQLRQAIEDAALKLRADARLEYIQQLAELVEGIDLQHLLEIAINENIALSGQTVGAPGGMAQPQSNERQGYGQLPPRGFVIERDSATSAPPVIPNATSWGPGAVESRSNGPEQWGPNEVQRIA